MTTKAIAPQSLQDQMVSKTKTCSLVQRIFTGPSHGLNGKCRRAQPVLKRTQASCFFVDLPSRNVNM